MSNHAIVGALFQEGTSQTRPPYFNGQISLTRKLEWRFTRTPMMSKSNMLSRKETILSRLQNSMKRPTDMYLLTLLDIDDYSDEQMVVMQINAKDKNYYTIP